MAPTTAELKAIQGREEQTKNMLRRSYQDLNKIARKGQILFTGSSLMEQFPVNEIAMSMGINKVLYNRGIGGTTTDEFLTHINTVLLDLEPSKVFINIGTNDIRPRSDGVYWQDHLLANYEKILTIIKQKLPETEVYMMAYYPINPDLPDAPEWTKHAFRTRTNEALNDTNQKLAGLAARFGCHFIDCNDGIKDEQGRQKAEFSKEGMHITRKPMWRYSRHWCSICKDTLLRVNGIFCTDKTFKSSFYRLPIETAAPRIGELP